MLLVENCADIYINKNLFSSLDATDKFDIEKKTGFCVFSLGYIIEGKILKSRSQHSCGADRAVFRVLG